jgi:hypothetical protein
VGRKNGGVFAGAASARSGLDSFPRFGIANGTKSGQRLVGLAIRPVCGDMSLVIAHRTKQWNNSSVVTLNLTQIHENYLLLAFCCSKVSQPVFFFELDWRHFISLC